MLVHRVLDDEDPLGDGGGARSLRHRREHLVLPGLRRSSRVSVRARVGSWATTCGSIAVPPAATRCRATRNSSTLPTRSSGRCPSPAAPPATSSVVRACSPCADSTSTAGSGWRRRAATAAAMPSSAWVRGIRTSVIAASGTPASTTGSGPGPSAALETVLRRSSRPASARGPVGSTCVLLRRPPRGPAVVAEAGTGPGAPAVGAPGWEVRDHGTLRSGWSRVVGGPGGSRRRIPTCTSTPAERGSGPSRRAPEPGGAGTTTTGRHRLSRASGRITLGRGDAAPAGQRADGGRGRHDGADSAAGTPRR